MPLSAITPPKPEVAPEANALLIVPVNWLLLPVAFSVRVSVSIVFPLRIERMVTPTEPLLPKSASFTVIVSGVAPTEKVGVGARLAMPSPPPTTLIVDEVMVVGLPDAPRSSEYSMTTWSPTSVPNVPLFDVDVPPAKAVESEPVKVPLPAGSSPNTTSSVSPVVLFLTVTVRLPAPLTRVGKLMSRSVSEIASTSATWMAAGTLLKPPSVGIIERTSSTGVPPLPIASS